jgi:uncharacterized protein with HEPN domain
MDEKKKHENMVQIVRSNIKDIEYRDLERIRDVVRDELFNRDMKLIQESCSTNMRRLEKGLHEVIKKEIKKEIEKKLKSSRVKK